MPIGVPELLIVLAIVLLVLGPKRLPRLGRSLGGGIRNFKREIRKPDERPDLEPGRDDDEPPDGEVVSDRRP
ncbi:MAG: sec-independent protein translocase protein TatA [Solirubrobacteraceae bacterium]|jgi:sec-independent protein translocase protein TatA|nr:sec-independent protein translocase protein TatA [Solirubrobacteraceae bacterium]